jgi:hypothetical protein
MEPRSRSAVPRTEGTRRHLSQAVDIEWKSIREARPVTAAEMFFDNNRNPHIEVKQNLQAINCLFFGNS